MTTIELSFFFLSPFIYKVIFWVPQDFLMLHCLGAIPLTIRNHWLTNAGQPVCLEYVLILLNLLMEVLEENEKESKIFILNKYNLI